MNNRKPSGGQAMTLLTRWDPFRDFSVLQDRVNRLFQEYTPSGEEQLSTTNFVPPVDVYEDEHHVTLKAELPGVDPKNVDIRIENNVLTVRGERKFEKEEKEENFHRIERRYGSFMRSFTLPNTVNPDSVKADYENGLLKVQFEKRAEAKPKQIQVNIGSGQKTIEPGKAKAA
jgi:HSP20 family protein